MPHPLTNRVLGFSVLLILLGSLGLQMVANRSHRHAITLLEADNELLRHELRLMQQQLEAERILASARLRLRGEPPLAREPDSAPPAAR